MMNWDITIDEAKTINGAVIDEIRKSGVISRGKLSKLMRIEKITSKLSQDLGRDPIVIEICDKAEIDKSKRVNQLNEDEVTKIRDLIKSNLTVEGALRREISMNIKRVTVFDTQVG